jgi:hypothetical protein
MGWVGGMFYPELEFVLFQYYQKFSLKIGQIINCSMKFGDRIFFSEENPDKNHPSKSKTITAVQIGFN